MSRRIDIELTSSRPDGTWTWRAAGAREPKGVLDGSLLEPSSAVGDVLRVEADFDLDGIRILSVVQGRPKQAPTNRLELLAPTGPFEAVTSQLATKPRSDRRERKSRSEGEERQRRPRRDDDRRERPAPAQGERRERRERSERRERPSRPAFTPPPELPARPKPKRLKPGRTHRNEVLSALPESERPVAERVLQGGIPAVRQAVKEQNERLAAEGKELIPADNLLAMAEELLPKLRVAEWLDRAEAAQRDLEELDLRDLRSVVAAADDPVVARDESTRELATVLREGLAAKQEREYELWLGDIEAALEVGRVIRAFKLSSQPPKAGVRFPAAVATKLAAAGSAALTPDDSSERWIAVLEAVAFSPVRTLVAPKGLPAEPTAELVTTVKRLAALLPQIAALFGVEAPQGAPLPKPLRPSRATGSPVSKART